MLIWQIDSTFNILVSLIAHTTRYSVAASELTIPADSDKQNVLYRSRRQLRCYLRMAACLKLLRVHISYTLGSASD